MTLTGRAGPDNIPKVLHSDDEKSVIERVLEPLLNGKVVALQVRDPRMAKKSRIKKKVLILVPMTEDTSYLLAAVPGYGAEMLDVRQEIKGIALYRLGISMALGSSLAKALNELFKEK